MTWYPAYTTRHEFLGVLHLNDRSQEAQHLQDHRWTQLTGTERIKLEDVIVKDRYGLMSIPSLFHVHVKLEEVARSVRAADPMRPYDRQTLFHYVTIEDPTDHRSLSPMNPELNWHVATFVPLGAPLMCEYCPDCKEDRRWLLS